MNDELTYKLFKAIEANPATNQRRLTTSLEMSLGKMEIERKILKKLVGLLRERISMRFEFIEPHKRVYLITVMCWVLNVSCSSFFAWCKKSSSKRDHETALLKPLVSQIRLRADGFSVYEHLL